MKKASTRSLSPTIFLILLFSLLIAGCVAVKEREDALIDASATEDLQAETKQDQVPLDGSEIDQDDKNEDVRDLDVLRDEGGEGITPSDQSDGQEVEPTGPCGDGTLDPGEACDDGNQNGGDYCSPDCAQISGHCGDGALQASVESCDDGNNLSGDYCSEDCQQILGSCGDGTLQSGVEGCDDGNTAAGDGCDASCQVEPAVCGDGVCESGEDASTCGADCAPGECSNGPLDAPIPNCSPTLPASTGDLYQDCVNRINQFRWDCQCLPPLQRWDVGEDCADEQAEYDSTHGAHAGFSANICSPRGWGQNECPGWGSTGQVLSGCLQMMWDEGPGEDFQAHGHYLNMSSTSFSQVACGFYTGGSGVWAVQNFQ